jgi:hypothetical protein
MYCGNVRAEARHWIWSEVAYDTLWVAETHQVARHDIRYSVGGRHLCPYITT